MSKSKLNNLVSFKDFTGNLPLNKQKRTKRTDVGLDVLNENFYDRFIYKIKNNLPIEPSIEEFERLLLKSIKAGTVSKLEHREDGYYFELRGRQFKISRDGKSSIKTPIQIKTDVDEEGKKIHTPIWTNFSLPKDVSSRIIAALDDIDYL